MIYNRINYIIAGNIAIILIACLCFILTASFLYLLNTPGTFIYSTMSYYGVYKGMVQVHASRGGKVVANSIFNIGTLSQQDATDCHELLVNRVIASI